MVDLVAIGRLPAPPLRTIDRTEFAIGIGPLVPNAHAVFLQITDVGVAAQQPQQFMDDGFGMQLLGGQQRKAGGQIETHLPTEHRARAGAGAITLVVAMFKHMAHQIEVLLHGAFWRAV